MSTDGFPDNLVPFKATLLRVLELKGLRDEHALLSSAQLEAIHTEHDNWNGGIDFYDLLLRVPLEVFIHYEPRLQDVETSLLDSVKTLWRGEDHRAISHVTVAPTSTPSDSPVPLGRTALPEFWALGQFRLFLSHCSSVKTDVCALQTALSKLGLTAFVAHVDIEPTKEWQVEIERALRSMEALVAVLTPDFVSSRWCDQEVGFALGRGQLVISIRHGADPHGFMGKNQGLTVLGGRLAASATDIVRILLARPETSTSMGNALIEAFRQSRSYANAKELMTLLELLGSLSKEQAKVLRTAASANSQVSDAYGVKNRLDRLLKLHGFKGVAT